MGYTKYNQELDPTDVVKFGKRVYGGEKVSNDEIMEAHLNQIRQNRDCKSAFNQDKKREELEFIDNVR